MNKKKTQTMVITRSEEIPNVKILIDGTCLEQVRNFKYLGQQISEDGRSEQEIKRRICIAKSTFEQMNKLLTNRKLSYKLKLRLVKCFIWSTFTYACETWTLTAEMERRIDALEMWMYRRMTRTSWKDKKTNVEVLEKVGLKNKEMLNIIKRRKLTYYGHISRHDSMQKDILEGKIEGTRGRGRPRKSWIGNIKETTRMTMQECGKRAKDRDKWRSMASNLCKE